MKPNFILACIVITVLSFTTASEVADICSLPKDPGPCEAAMSRYYFNSNTSQCEKFTYGGCKGNANNFELFNECDGLCGVCSWPNDPGPCEGFFPRYFFNTNTGLCERFTYGGCEGNGNNFEKLESCEQRCRDVLCYLPRDPGPCMERLPSYYYNLRTNQCEKFIYGGCLGNANNFATLKQCKSRCHSYK